MMDNTDLEQRCNALRHDLKTWEKKFAAAHDGRKAGRVDIKANAEICRLSIISLKIRTTY